MKKYAPDASGKPRELRGNCRTPPESLMNHAEMFGHGRKA